MAKLKDVTRRHLVAQEPVYMECVNKEIYIKPKKWSEETGDLMIQYGRSFLKTKEGQSALVKLRRLQDKVTGGLANLKESDINDEDVLDLAEISAMMQEEEKALFHRSALGTGIGEHNVEDDNGKLICEGKRFDKKTIDFILEWKDLADEMFSAIQAYNRPLASGSDGKSQTSQNGSMPEQNSSQEKTSSLTATKLVN